MSHLLAGMPKDVVGSIVLLPVHLQPLFLTEFAQQPVIPAGTIRHDINAKLVSVDCN